MTVVIDADEGGKEERWRGEAAVFIGFSWRCPIAKRVVTSSLPGGLSSPAKSENGRRGEGERRGDLNAFSRHPKEKPRKLRAAGSG